MRYVSPQTFLLMCLTQPMTPQSQLMVSTVWVIWFQHWLAMMNCYGIEVKRSQEDPTLITAKFRIQGMPEMKSVIDLPVDDSPYKVTIQSGIHTKCSLKETGER